MEGFQFTLINLYIWRFLPSIMSLSKRSLFIRILFFFFFFGSNSSFAESILAIFVGGSQILAAIRGLQGKVSHCLRLTSHQNIKINPSNFLTFPTFFFYFILFVVSPVHLCFYCRRASCFFSPRPRQG